MPISQMSDKLNCHYAGVVSLEHFLRVHRFVCICYMQGSHKLWKSWNTWKITKKSSIHGKVMEFEKT